MSPKHTTAARWLTATVLFVTLLASSFATIGVSYQMQLGNPSTATSDPANHAHYLIQRDQYVLDFNDTTHEPNWVSWDLTADDSGSAGRSPNFFQDTTLPAGFYQVLTTDYSGSGYDRGHMCPSADRTATRADNDFTFYMSNMVPQSPDNNQGVWASFESYCRTLALAGNELLIISGPSGFAGSTIASGVAIPSYTWKIVVVVPAGPGTAVDRIVAAGASAIRVIAIKIPNIAGVRSTPWENFVTSPAQIQADTGYTFFTSLPAPIASAFRSVVDGQSAAGSPVITGQPNSQTTVVGGSATFSVTASGDAPLSYQWTHDDVDIPGATGATLTLNNVQAADVGSYYVVVTNGVGSTTSAAATLTVTGLPPVVVSSPASQTVNAGANVTFAVAVTGSPTLAYQWRKAGSPISGANAATLTLANVQAADAASYDVFVSNGAGIATSAPALLTVNPSGPVITGQPASRTAVTADNASFTVTASGSAPLAYQWRKEGAPLADGGAISGAATATLLLTGVTAVNGGNYDVVVTNALGNATSAVAALTVNPPPPSTVYWDFGPAATPTANPTSGLNADITGGTLTQGNNNGTTPLLTTTSASTPTSTFSGANNAGAAARTGALNKAAGGSAYFEFTLAPSAGKRLLATGLSFGSRSTSTGPAAFAVFTNLDNYTTPVATGTLTVTGNNWLVYTPAFTGVTGTTGTPITFRIYGYNGTGSASANTANWRIDDLKLTVSAVFPPPVAPVVTATAPANGATGVVVTDPITVTFNEAVGFTGSWFTITGAASGPLAATVQGGPTTYTLATPSGLAYNDTVTVSIIGSQVVDQASGTIHGGSNTTFAFTTQSYMPPTPPAVTGQPAAQTVFAGGSASFSVTATGTAPLAYQWRKNGTPISGNSTAATATLALASVSTADAGNYSCVVSNVAGSDVSSAAALTVNLVPASITTQPAAQLVAAGGTATFTVGAAGTAPLAYQWRHNGTPVANDARVTGAGSATLTITGVTPGDNGAYDVVVSNPAGSATSNPVQLAVAALAPGVIFWDFTTANPASGVPAGVTGGTVTQGNNNGTTALLTATSASTPTTTFSGGNNAGAAARIGTLNKAANGSAYFEFTFTPDAGRQFAASALTFGARSTGTGPQAYAVFSSVDNFTSPLAAGTLLADSVWRVITTTFAGVTGAAGTPVTFRIYGYNGTGSPAAGTANWRIDDVRLTASLLAAAPTITLQPAAQAATVGDTVVFTVAADGSAPFSYQWRRNGVALLGNPSATTAALSLPGIVTAQAGDYDCVVTNVVGSATSNPATLTVNKAVAAVALGTLDFVYSGSPAATTATTTPDGLTVNITYDGGTAAPVNAGSYAVVATIDDPDYVGTASGTLTIAKAVAGVTLGNLGQSYDGAPKFAAALTNPGGLAVVLSYDGGPAAPVNAGSYAVVAVVNDANFTGTTSATLNIAKAAATVTLGNLTQTFNGSPRPVSAITAPGGLAVDLTYDGSAAAPVNAGSYAVAAAINDANYVGTASATLNVAKAAATVTLGDLSQTYNGAPRLASAVTNPGGLAVDLTYDGSAAAPVNAGSYAVVGTVNDANYVGTASATLNVAKAAATVTLGDLSQTYNGAPRLASAVTNPGGLAVDLTYDGSATAPTNAGSYAVVAVVNDANYTGTASGTLNIGKATASVTLGNLAQTYDGAPKPVAVSTSPAGLAVDLTYDGSAIAPTNAGSYAVVGTVNNANYAGTASATLNVAKAVATVTLGGLNQTYTGAAKSVSAVTSPAGLTVGFTYDGNAAAPVNAGSYAAVATINETNYAGTASGTLIVAKAAATVILGNLAQTYDGAPKPVTASTTPAGLTVGLTYDGSATAPVNAGSYAVVATINETNYAGTTNGTLNIGRATASVTLANLAQTYDGAPKPVTASTTPAGLTVNFTYNGNAAAPVNAGSYAVVGTVNHANYAGTASGTLVVAKAAATVTLGGLNQTYDGAAKSVSAVTNPASLTVNFTYNGNAAAPVNAGSYAVVGTVNHANYAGMASGTLVVAKAVASVTLGNLAQVYDGAAKPVSVTTAPAGLNTVTTYNGNATAPSAVGSYTVVSSVQEANYVGTASGTLVITQAGATVTLSRLVQAYDGTPKPVSVATTPGNLTVVTTYNGSSTAPTYPGSYAVVATINETSYQGTASGTLVITTTAIVRHAPTLNGGIDGSLQVMSPESTTLNGGALLGGDLLVPGTPSVQLNGHPVYAGTIDASGTSSPTNYQITLNGNAALRHIVRRVNAVALPVVTAPPAPAGTRDVSLNNSSQSPGAFATLRNLTLNGNGISVAVPAGTYGTFTLNGNNVITLGTAGATTPAVYNLQGLTLNGSSQIQVAGPVIINLAAGISLNGSMGNADHPEWLLLNIATGGLTLNGNVSCEAYVLAPAGTVTINGNSTLSGGVIADRLTINGNGLLKVEDPD